MFRFCKTFLQQLKDKNETRRKEQKLPFLLNAFIIPRRAVSLHFLAVELGEQWDSSTEVSKSPHFEYRFEVKDPKGLTTTSVLSVIFIKNNIYHNINSLVTAFK